MKKSRFVNAVGYIDDDLITDAIKSTKSSRKSIGIKWVSLAACFAVLLIAAAVAGPMLSGDGNIAPFVDIEDTAHTKKNEITVPDINNEINNIPSAAEKTDPSVNSESTNSSLNGEHHYTASRPYVESTVENENTTLTVHEAFGYVKRYFYKVDEGDFSTYIGGRVISEDKIGEKIADVSVTAGWETWVGTNLTETVPTENLRAEIYSIVDISNDVAVALKFNDKGEALTTTRYYVIMNPNADLTAVEDYIIIKAVPNNYGDEISGEAVADNEIGEVITVKHTAAF